MISISISGLGRVDAATATIRLNREDESLKDYCKLPNARPLKTATSVQANQAGLFSNADTACFHPLANGAVEVFVAVGPDNWVSVHVSKSQRKLLGALNRAGSDGLSSADIAALTGRKILAARLAELRAIGCRISVTADPVRKTKAATRSSLGRYRLHSPVRFSRPTSGAVACLYGAVPEIERQLLPLQMDEAKERHRQHIIGLNARLASPGSTLRKLDIAAPSDDFSA